MRIRYCACCNCEIREDESAGFDFDETNDDDSEYSNEIVEEDFNPDKEVDE